MEGTIFGNCTDSISSDTHNFCVFIETPESYISTHVMDKIMLDPTTTDIILTIDRSGSMGLPMTNKTQNKTSIVMNAIKSCIVYLQTLIAKGKNVRFSLVAFDDSAELVIDSCTNPADQLSVIESAITPVGSTDIGNAIDKTNEQIEKLLQSNTIENIHAILLTDGYHNSKLVTTSEIETKFKTCKYVDCYSCIGIGQITDYDSTFMMQMFDKFHGAPTNTELYDNIIGNVFNATSVIYSDFKIEILNLNGAELCTPLQFKDGVFKLDTVDFSQKFYFAIKNVDPIAHPKITVSCFNKLSNMTEIVVNNDTKLSLIENDDKLFRLCELMERFTKITEITVPQTAIDDTTNLLEQFTQLHDTVPKNGHKMNSIQNLIDANIEIVRNHLSELMKYKSNTSTDNFLNYSTMNKRQITNTVSGGRVLSVSRGYSDNLSQTYHPPVKYTIT